MQQRQDWENSGTFKVCGSNPDPAFKAKTKNFVQKSPEIARKQKNNYNGYFHLINAFNFNFPIYVKANGRIRIQIRPPQILESWSLKDPHLTETTDLDGSGTILAPFNDSSTRKQTYLIVKKGKCSNRVVWHHCLWRIGGHKEIKEMSSILADQ